MTLIRSFVALPAALICCFIVQCHAADSDSPTITDPDKAGLAYKIQGEYEGAVAGDQHGAQVIALGNGRFRTVGYAGGLPGSGWTQDERRFLDGKLDGNHVEMQAAEFSIKIDGSKLHVYDLDGSTLGTLDKVHRKSKTLGAKPPAGATVLFDGTSIEAWNKAKLVEDKYLGATGCYTKEKFGDHELHLEFRTPFMPAASGQARGNSGVYVQSRYEVQVLDSFALDGKDNECGGIYQVAKPKVNMCYPPLVWQTYDIQFTAAKWENGKKVKNARVTIRHNGVVIHRDLELPKHTPGRDREADGPAPLFLQDHGNPVVYRNIWVVKK